MPHRRQLKGRETTGWWCAVRRLGEGIRKHAGDLLEARGALIGALENPREAVSAADSVSTLEADLPRRVKADDALLRGLARRQIRRNRPRPPRAVVDGMAGGQGLQLT